MKQNGLEVFKLVQDSNFLGRSIRNSDAQSGQKKLTCCSASAPEVVEARSVSPCGAATLNAAPDQRSLSLFGRNRVHGPALALAREHEALVALLCDLGALSAVSANALR